MYEYGVCDAKTRVTFVPVRKESETGQQALYRQHKDVGRAIQRLIAVLARRAAREDFEATRKGSKDPKCL